MLSRKNAPAACRPIDGTIPGLLLAPGSHTHNRQAWNAEDGLGWDLPLMRLMAMQVAGGGVCVFSTGRPSEVFSLGSSPY